MWNGFIWALSWITRCLGWKIGNGKHIKIGLDPIAGVTSDYTLPEGLRLYLEDYGIVSLSDALNRGVACTSLDYWISADDLKLVGDLKESWSNYIKGLMHGGICISNNPDTLVWLYNKSLGSVKANPMYDFIANTNVSDKSDGYLSMLWELHIPLKIICFNWLSLHNKINTYDNMIIKGWTGPYWCCLCRSATESVEHLFQYCSFTKRIIGFLKVKLNIPHF